MIARKTCKARKTGKKLWARKARKKMKARRHVKKEDT